MEEMVVVFPAAAAAAAIARKVSEVAVRSRHLGAPSGKPFTWSDATTSCHRRRGPRARLLLSAPPLILGI